MVAAPPLIDSEVSPMTLTRYMIQHAMDNTDLEHLQDMQSLMASIQLACKKISSLVMRAGISNLTGLESGGGSVNVQGEEQKKLDVLSNEVLKNALRFSGKMGIIASEEEDEPVMVDEIYSGNYVAVFDPLDGSSNIDAGIATGTIFGIFAENTGCLASDWESKIDQTELTCLQNTMQPGANLVASGYCMYSSSCMMVLTTGKGVNGFTLDPQIGEFVLTNPNMRVPARGSIYSVNEANSPAWDPTMKQYIDNLKNGAGQSGKKYSSRYIGSMVADVHRTIMYGGIFAYPGDAKNKNGKLRLLYEAAPMAFIIEQAGGEATTGTERIMDCIPNSIHQRVPVILGSKDDVNEIKAMYAKAAK
jgi:fructose-1,6-bisphosphatase I